MLDHGADPHRRLRGKWTPIDLAAKREGALANPAECDPVAGCMGLLGWRCGTNRPEILELLLDLGFDPNERMRARGADEILYSAGGPLFCCVIKRSRAMAEMLLARGADPNSNVYTSGTPFYGAHSEKNPGFHEAARRA